MDRLERTAIAIANAKETALYFDYVIPVNLGVDIITETHFAFEARKQRGETALPFKEGISHLPPTLADLLLPPQLLNWWHFRDRLAAVNQSTLDLILNHLAVQHGLPMADPNKYGRSIETAGENLLTFLNEFDLGTTPVDARLDLITEGTAAQSDVSITMASLSLVDATRAPWEQILEFRRDDGARDKLRRLRLFALANYSGKSRSFIEDDISVKVSDYEAAVRKWGFDTKYGAFTMLLSSKTLAGALTGSLISTLFGAPLPALASAGVGVGLEIGRIALEVNKQRFVLRSLMANNPVCYISQARSKLRTGRAVKPSK
jgi:hypothetical protein